MFEKRHEEARQLVLEALQDHTELTGWDLANETGLSTGRLYAALAELEKASEITSHWGDGPKPRSRYYRIVERASSR